MMKKNYLYILLFISSLFYAQNGADIKDLVKLNSAQAVNTNRILVTDGNGNLGYRTFSGVANTATTLNVGVQKTSIAKPAIFRNLPDLKVNRFITVDDAGNLGYRDLSFVSSSTPITASGKIGLSAVNLIYLGTILSTQQNGYGYAVVIDGNGVLGKRPFSDIVFTSTRTASCSGNFTRNNCGSGYTGGTVTYTQSSTATATSTISQADADANANNAAYSQACALVNAGGQNYANSNGTCTQNTWTSTKYSTKCADFVRNNCPQNYTGSTYTYCAYNISGNYTSTVSQADADAKAQQAADANAQANVIANGQNAANLYGGCSNPCAGNTAPVVYDLSPYADTSIPEKISFNGGYYDAQGGTTDTWDFGDGTIINWTSNLTPSHTYTACGTYTVRRTVTDNCGATASKTTTITISNVQSVPAPVISNLSVSILNYIQPYFPTDFTPNPGNGRSYPPTDDFRITIRVIADVVANSGIQSIIVRTGAADPTTVATVTIPNSPTSYHLDKNITIEHFDPEGNNPVSFYLNVNAGCNKSSGAGYDAPFADPRPTYRTNYWSEYSNFSSGNTRSWSWPNLSNGTFDRYRILLRLNSGNYFNNFYNASTTTTGFINDLDGLYFGMYLYNSSNWFRWVRHN